MVIIIYADTIIYKFEKNSRSIIIAFAASKLSVGLCCLVINNIDNGYRFLAFLDLPVV